MPQHEIHILNQEVLDYLGANGAKTLMDAHIISIGEKVSCVPNGKKIRITGAMFQTWIPIEMYQRMALAASEGSDE